jgi:catechol 2,3-dioxygenase-like lactoylglutathione lyase family enzyme
METRHASLSALLATSILLSMAPTVGRSINPADQVPPVSVSGLSGVTFLTTDLAPLRRFYGQGAGLAEAPEGPSGIRFVVGARQWIAFQSVSDGGWARRLQHVTLEAADLDGLESVLRARGVSATWTGSDPRKRALQLADPAGNLIQVTKSWAPPAAADTPTAPFSNHLQHIGLAVAYPLAEPTMAFYREILGFPEVFRLNAPGGRLALVKFRIPGPGKELIELIFFDPPLNKWAAGAFDHVNFEVSNIDDAYQTLHRRGIATQSKHLPTVNGEHLWAIDIIDPELTRVEVQVLAPTSAPVGTISTVGGVSARPLFDGRTLAGWEGNMGNWRAEDGAIVGGALDRRQPHNEFLATTADYGDFELRLQYKIEGAGGFVNGGVQFWSQRVPGTFEVSGYQADLGADKDGNLYDESRRDAELAAPSPEARDRALRKGAWNDYRIRAEKAHIEIWLNGAKTVDYTEKAQGIPQRGKFALQIHGGANTKVSYRNLEFESLPDPAQTGH